MLFNYNKMEEQYLIYEKARQDVSEKEKKDSKDTVCHTDQYLETLMSSESGCHQYFCLIMNICYNIMIGASTVMLEYSYSSIQLFFIAHLSSSDILLPSTAIATFFMFPFWNGIVQFNSG